MKYEDLYNMIVDRFDWWELEDEETDKRDLKRALKTKDEKYLLDVLNWFKVDYYETKEEKDLPIINRLEDILNMEIIKA